MSSITLSKEKTMTKIKTILLLTKRHLKIFFADRSHVFFTFLSSLISIILFLAFLLKMNAESLSRVLSVDLESTILFMTNYLFAGQLTLIIFSATLAAMSVFIKDIKYDGSDISIWPIPKSQVIISYILQSIVISLILSIASLSLELLFLGLRYQLFFSIFEILQLLGLIVLGSFFSAMVSLTIALFIKTESAFSSIGTLLNTLSGFAIGLYVPIGALPQIMKDLLPFNPYLGLTSLFRQTFAASSFNDIVVNVPDSVKEEVSKELGITLVSFGHTWTNPQIYLSIVVVTIILFIIQISIFRRKEFLR